MWRKLLFVTVRRKPTYTLVGLFLRLRLVILSILILRRPKCIYVGIKVLQSLSVKVVLFYRPFLVVYKSNCQVILRSVGRQATSVIVSRRVYVTSVFVVVVVLVILNCPFGPSIMSDYLSCVALMREMTSM